jgi:hypothetical protein
MMAADNQHSMYLQQLSFNWRNSTPPGIQYTVEHARVLIVHDANVSSTHYKPSI